MVFDNSTLMYEGLAFRIGSSQPDSYLPPQASSRHLAHVLYSGSRSYVDGIYIFWLAQVHRRSFG